MADDISVKVIRHTVEDVRQRWREQYGRVDCANHAFAHGNLAGKTVHDVTVQLDTATTLADVNAVFGNDTWTTTLCDLCGAYVTACLQLGDEPDYESATVNACFACAIRVGEIAKGQP